MGLQSDPIDPTKTRLNTYVNTTLGNGWTPPVAQDV